MILNLAYNNENWDLSFFGIKVFQVKNVNLFTKNFYIQCLESKFSNCEIYKNNLFIISDFTKVSDLLQMSKNSILFKNILDILLEENFLDEKILLKVLDNINNKFDCEILEEKKDINKIVNNLFEINENLYLNKKIFLKILSSNIFSEKITFIINDLSWLKVKDINSYINSYNFIFITNDFRKNISNIKELEIVVFVNKMIFEVVDHDKLISFLEKEINFNNLKEKLKFFIDNNDNYEDDFSLKIMNLLNNLEKKL